MLLPHLCPSCRFASQLKRVQSTTKTTLDVKKTCVKVSLCVRVCVYVHVYDVYVYARGCVWKCMCECVYFLRVHVRARLRI